MRVLLLSLAAALCPVLGAAQSNFVAGSYELADGTKGAGQLEYQPGNHPKLLVKDAAADPASKAGKKGQAYSPEQVRSFDLGPDHYVLLHSIKLDSGMPMSMSMTKKDEFAKVVETGKLELLQYQVFYAGMGYAAPGGAGRSSSPQNTVVYLLRRQGEDNATMVPVGAKKYREVMTAYFAGRPELLKKLSNQPKNESEFRALVQEYNAGQ
ncbi:hypothetical protein [Hymenobacter properus]|uniref:Uncharacterized protein n=1 Tax=Hymenobacter properus TaxID=2791026 RepID=A0A931BHT6_9BACT|nr:hypothetical protein [Hymenobacter properus]MBF9144219.1 hypothetical protein [Hymenobacter properus]MBR7723037.1 hypothetical protein [Microvirga sp. SRT04]